MRTIFFAFDHSFTQNSYFTVYPEEYKYFPTHSLLFFCNRSSCFLLFDQSKFYMFKVGTDLYFIFLPHVCRCTFFILRLFLCVYTCKVRFIVLFYLKYDNLYFNAFSFVNILLFPIISLYLPVFPFIKSLLSYLTFVLLSLS